jgi:hypothetical protein
MGQSCWQSWAFLTSLASFANSFGAGCWQRWASPEARAQLCQQLRPMLLAKKTVGKAGLLCQQLRPMLLAKQAVGKAVVPFVNRTLPTAVASLLAKVTTSELTASPLWRSFPNRARVPVGEELFPIT